MENQTETKNETKYEFILDEHIVSMLISEPFFAALSRRIDKTVCREIPTAGVRINKHSQNFELMYNPDFFAKLESDKQRCAVLRHEYYHLILEHVTGRRPGDISEDMKGAALAKFWNYATDLAINSHLPELPEFCLFPGKGEFKDYPPAMNAEYYYNKLKNDPKNQEMLEQLEKLQEMLGNHENWSPSDGSGSGAGDAEQEAANDMAKEKLKEILRKAVGECAASNSWGTISQEMRKDILERLKSRVDWRNLLRYFIKASQRANKISSIRRINKRYAYVHPGKRITRLAKIAIAIDQSGSVGDDLLCAFFSELDALAKLAEFTVIPFDHAVAPPEKIFVWKKGERRNTERVLTGGTDFDAPTKYVNEHGNFDGFVVLTDMQAPKPGPCKCQRIWLTDVANAEHPYFTSPELVVPIVIGTKK